MKQRIVIVILLIVGVSITITSVFAAGTVETFTAPWQLQDSSNGQTRVYVDGSGNVGIGTTTPTAKLQITTPGGGNLYVTDYGCGAYGGMGGSSTLTGCTNYALLTAGGDTFINRPSGNSIRFREANNEQMIIAPGGNVGVGTTSPQKLLDIDGPMVVGMDAQYGAFTRIAGGTLKPWFAESSGGTTFYDAGGTAILFRNQADSAELMRITDGGNVGIGVSNPAQKLEVNGGIQADGNLTTSATNKEFKITAPSGVPICIGTGC